MQTETMQIRILIPSEGMLLTQKELTNESERVFSNRLYLSVIDTPDSWQEVPISRQAEWDAVQAALNAENENEKTTND